MSKVALFDMDGTLTEPRSLIASDMVDSLISLSKKYKIGIVSGSNFDYIMEQCGSLFKKNRDLSNFTIFPCNGTQKYTWDKNEWETGSWKKESSLNMRLHLGELKYRRLISMLSETLYRTHMVYGRGMGLSGNFIVYRDSMINWCPIGRLATKKDREDFVKFDREYKIRERSVGFFNKNPLSELLTFSLGGSTSVDIYPKGWDKSFVLTHLEEDDKVWFIGDRCTTEYGNDKPLYDEIRKKDKSKAYEVKSTVDTKNIINELIGLSLDE
jgi:phosphomannomutase